MFDFKKIFDKKVAQSVTEGLSSVNPVEGMTRSERQEVADKATLALQYLTSAVIFLAPLLFVPLLTDWFDLPRQSFVLVGSLLILVVWFVRSVLENKLAFTRSAFLAPAFFLALAAVVSALLTDNKVYSLSSDPILYAGLLFLFVAVCQIVTSTKTLVWFIKVLLAAGAILSVLTIIQVVLSLAPGFQNLVANSPLLSLAFSPTGSPLSQAIFLGLLLPVGAGLYFESRKNKTDVSAEVLFALVGVGLIASVYALLRQNPILLPQDVGWKIATATLGNSLVSAFFGTGPGNFVDAFTASKPLSFNNSLFWNLRFTTSSNLYFYLLTTTGIAGLVSFLLIVVKVLHLARKRFESQSLSPLERGLIGSSVVAIVLFALLPAPSVALIAFFVILALLTGFFQIAENSTYAAVMPDLSAHNTWFRPGGVIITLALLVLAVFHLGKLVLADYNFALSIIAANKNQGTETYNRQIDATSLNPWNDSYHMSYSQTNLALADALAGQPNLTDQQKQTVVALVQQAIREGRLAVGLAPNRAADWENLSLIYRGLINFAQGADQWALASQNQAVALDPTNPRLRLDLGGTYYAQKDYQTAAQVFATAANLKPDYANAHYNLAQAMKLLNLNDLATQQLQLTANLVCAAGQTPDCQRVNSEIQSLGAKPAASPAATLTPETPSPALATPSSETNLIKAKTQPPAKITSPSGQLSQ